MLNYPIMVLIEMSASSVTQQFCFMMAEWIEYPNKHKEMWPEPILKAEYFVQAIVRRC